MLDPQTWLKAIIRATIRPRPRSRLWKWLDRWAVVPEEAGGPCTGRLRTGRVPIFRGIYDLAQRRGVHFITVVASARVGKTLFSICMVLYWIGERFGHVVWLDPTRKSAVKLVRTELEEFLLQCKPVRDLAIISRKTWTTLEKSFRGKLFRIVASGAEADLHGFNAELAIINERDLCRASVSRDAASYDKIVARTKLFTGSRLVIDNSTPGEGGELSPTWQSFLRRSQHYCYFPCPHCSREKKTRTQRRRDAKAAKAKAFKQDLQDGQDGKGKLPRRHPVNPLNPANPVENSPAWTPPSEEDVEPGRSPLSYEPSLRGWQRLSFFIDQKLVPFDKRLEPIRTKGSKRGVVPPRDKWREEKTGQFKFSQFAIYEQKPRLDDPTQTEPIKVGYDMEGVEAGTTYECAWCKKDIEFSELGWMLDRYRWIAHNPAAPKDKLSFQIWAAQNPFEFWGLISKQFIEAKGNLGAMITFFQHTLGLPFIRASTVIKEDDIDRVIARTPDRYVQGQIPREAEVLTITIDVQGTQFWFVIRAWGILWDTPDWPTWSALVDWGEAVSWGQLLEICGLQADARGHIRKFVFNYPDGTSREYVITSGLVDSGFEAQDNKDVYSFCQRNSAIFSPSKGGDASKTRGNTVRLSPIMDDSMDLVWFWSDYFACNLYYDCIKDGATIAGTIYWWLPVNVDRHYKTQLTDELQIEKDGRRVWDSRTKNNHLGDCEKQQRVLSGFVEEILDGHRAERAAVEKAAEEKGQH